MTIGRATYEAGMALVEHVGKSRWGKRMHGRTCGHGRFRLRNRGHEQWVT